MEGRYELVEQVFGAREAVRLKQHVNALVGRKTRGRQCRFDFRGVMAVIVDDGHAMFDAANGEAAIDPGESAEAFPNPVDRDFHFQADADGGCGVQDVVKSGNGEMEIAQVTGWTTHRKVTAGGRERYILDFKVHLRAATVSDRAAAD